jgi:malonyl-CoA O-methyltransferase
LQLNCEYLPATEQAQQELVLLHGWGSGPAIWCTLLVSLRPWANVSLVEIPGCAPGAGGGPGDARSLDEVLAGILACSPQRAVFVGWSLGGQLAVEIAARYPARVEAIVTLCSNPCFVQRDDWPGMPATDFTGFRRAFSNDPVAGLRRFDSLQVGGSPRPRQRMRLLQKLARATATATMQTGLRWLEEFDQRRRLAALSCPQLHMLGQQDGLVPASLEMSLGAILDPASGARVEMLEDCSHVATLDAPERVVGRLAAFLDESGLRREAEAPPELLAKRDIAASFSRAAPVYDSVAQLQRDVGERLLQRLDGLGQKPTRVLDLGCGTGHFHGELQKRFPQAEYWGLDIAAGMVEYARAHHPDGQQWLVGDAEALPLAGASVDLVFSSLAIQWCYRPQLLFAELARVLRPGGCCVFTSLGPDTLGELRAAWAAVDSHQHVNRFLPVAELEAAALRVPGITLSIDTARFRMEYQRVRDLLTELKTLGAHNMNRDRPGGLTSRRALQGMLQAYEQCREAGLLPATYDVILGTMEK